MAGWIAEMIFMLFFAYSYCCVTDRTWLSTRRTGFNAAYVNTLLPDDIVQVRCKVINNNNNNNAYMVVPIINH